MANDRRLKVLSAIVTDYVRTREPVGSKALVERYRLGVSPATIRNDMAALEALGWPHADQADVAQGWQRILATVRSYKDLEPSLLGRMEELIDFVTAPGTR